MPEPPPLAVLPGGAGVPQVEEETIRGVLIAKGEVLHLLDGASKLPGADDVWRYTQADLAAIAPPLTRILNRYPAAAAAAAELGDPMAAGIGLFNYGLRNLQTRRAAMRALEYEEEDEPAEPPPFTVPGREPEIPEPVQGPDGPAGGGPPPDEEEPQQWTV